MQRLWQWLCKLLGGHYYKPRHWMHRFKALDINYVHYIEVCSRCGADRPRLLELTAELQEQLQVPVGFLGTGRRPEYCDLAVKRLG